jgi:hypothetical protein
LGIGFIAFFFVYYLRAEVPFGCRQAFPGKEKCLLDLLQSVLHLQTIRNVVRIEKTDSWVALCPAVRVGGNKSLKILTTQRIMR